MKKMTNEERYRASFDNLHLSEDFRLRLGERLEREERKVKDKKVFRLGWVATAAAALVLTCGSVCYAADLGGIRTNIRLWIGGRSENVEVQDMGNGTYVWTDENGDNHSMTGVSKEAGKDSEVMSAEELAARMNNSAELEFGEDGRILFRYHNLSEDVTDLIGPDQKLSIHVDDPANPNTYFDFTDIGKGTYSMECSEKAAEGTDYHEADAAGLISDEPVGAYDDTEVFVTTMTSD